MIAALVTTTATGRADVSPASPTAPAIGPPPPAPASAPSLLRPRDYDAPDPYRNVVSYIHAGAGVSLINYLIWQWDWIIDSEYIYRVTGRDIVRNTTNGFPLDDDTLNANFFGHPYSGSMFFGAARSAGLTIWESAPYVLGGSLMWEWLSESQKPSGNDLVTTSLGGFAIGEISHRISSLALDDSTTGISRLTREVLAFGVSPPRGINRVVTTDAWTDAAPPVPKPARIVARAGLDRVAAGSVTDKATFGPSIFVAVDAEYGNLLPAEGKTSIPAYDFFDFYAAAVLTSQRTSGFEIDSVGLLQGWASDLTDDDGPFRSNNVFGIVQSTDFQGADALEFAGFGLGVGDFLVLRDGPHKRLRLGADLGWAPLAAVSSAVNPFIGTGGARDYNFSMGASVGLSLRWDMGTVGHIGLAAREYATTVVNGTPGDEHFGYARLWYEVEAVRNLLGVGMAPKVMYRNGEYRGGRSDVATQLSLQFYGTLRL